MSRIASRFARFSLVSSLGFSPLSFLEIAIAACCAGDTASDILSNILNEKGKSVDSSTPIFIPIFFSRVFIALPNSFALILFLSLGAGNSLLTGM